MMLAGAMAIRALPVAQYPNIAPPAIQITATYPGASAESLQDTVTQVIENNMTGLDHLAYMSSTSDSNGQSTTTLTFSADADPDIAQVQVQNKLQLAMPFLPQEVQKQGVAVEKSAANYLLVICFYSEDGKMTATDIGDYISNNIEHEISRLTGVGEVTLFGSGYAMRVWLDPSKLNSYGFTPGDIQQAISAQNADVSAGQLGGMPSVPGQRLNVTVTAQSRLKSVEEFEKILLRVNQDGSAVRLKDVARVELGAENYDVTSRFNGQPASALAVKLASGANALETADAIKEHIKTLEPFFPHGLKNAVAYDTTPFVSVSIKEVVKTLFEAIVLVFLVMFLFLQNIRATLIPTIAVPVVLLGTFAALAAFGFTINTLTMFGLVLAIGLLVDDAIVVVENVERIMHDEHLSPKEAAKRSMDQITGALVGIAMVLAAVFIPMAFFGGSTGVIYRQFSITLVAAMGLSVIVALVLTPSLCATMLKPAAKGKERKEGGFFGWFNRMFDSMSKRYERTVGGAIRRLLRLMLIYALLLGGLGFLFLRMPTAFLPDEDQGILFAQAQLRPGATAEETLAAMKIAEDYFLTKEKDSVFSILSVVGFSFSGNGQNCGMAFIRLKDWDERDDPQKRVAAVAGRAMREFSQVKNAQLFAFPPPAIVELGTSLGFDAEMQNRGALSHERFTAELNKFLTLARQNPHLQRVRHNGQEDTTQFRVNIDQEKARAFGITIGDINSTLSAAWGSTYVNDFIHNGQVKKVLLQGEASSRMAPEDLNKWYVRNSANEMTPFASFSSTQWTYGPPRLERYNGVPSFEVLGEPVPGESSGTAMLAVEEIARQLDPGVGLSWTGLSYQERLSGSQAGALYALSILVVFLCLAALYESWSIPLSVILVIPIGVLGAILGATGRGLSNDIYFQVGLLATIGLSAKNAILIVEFAKDLHEKQGLSFTKAAQQACRLRLRPILMTSLAFGLGVLPLVLSTGAGAGGQNAIGTGVFFGTVVATCLGIFYIPTFYVLICRLASGRLLTDPPAKEAVKKDE